MADVHKPIVRSKNMKAIRSYGTAIEMKLATILDSSGFEFRTQVKELPGTPDFVLDYYKKIIFTHGCFWHYHKCHMFKIPSTRTDFWMTKIRHNASRDKDILNKLNREGWDVMVIWECAIRGKKKISILELSERIDEWVCAGNSSVEINSTGMHEVIN